MERSIITRDGLTLWTEAFGDPADPAILLIMGGTAQGIVWPDELCWMFADSACHVVRFDHRDTGRSSKCEYGYDLSALAEDAADVITGLGLAPAHVVGQSVGGMAAQLLALHHPVLVRSLVLLSSSPDANGDVNLPPVSGLPGPLRPMLDLAAALTVNPPATREARLEAAVAGWRVLVGPAAPFREPYWRDLVERAMRRAPEPDTAGQHLRALDRTPPLTARIAGIRVPTLVVHGGQDPVFPVEHGSELVRAIAGARLVEIAGLGHIFPPEWSATIHALVLEHLRQVESRRPW
ncbi:alpha/beta fold hydrolase [Streptomyces jumonjinensis]|uniref:alpha/beta fold hydrolase n=1 Tax=Streptomyces jumonjinensis TaxID=1945 RepID=UPI0037B393B3